LSWPDLVAYAGVVAIEETGGPTIPFYAGRFEIMTLDEKKHNFSSIGTVLDTAGVLHGSSCIGEASMQEHSSPGGSRWATLHQMRQQFSRLGLNDRDMVALMGAHTLGRCHTHRSGHWGPWTTNETRWTNDYYRGLLEESWSLKLSHNGQPWEGPEQSEDTVGQRVRLPTDLVLLADPELKAWVTLYAHDERRWMRDFAAAFGKLMQRGCPVPPPRAPWWKWW
jgi:cytochrome c peroxidase